MKKQISILFLAFLLISVFSCRREESIPNDSSVDSFNSMVISDNFEFKTTQEINLQIQVLDQVTSIIEVYNGNPDQDGVLLKKGVTGGNNTFETLLVLPGKTNEIYAVRYSFDGSVSQEKIPLSSTNLVYHFGSKNLKSAQTTNYLVNPGSWPDCTSAYDFDVPNNYSGDLDIPANEIWRIDVGNNYTGELDFPSWGTNYLIICGTATIDDVKSGVGTVIVTSTGTLYIEDDYIAGWGTNLINFGTVEVKAGSSWKEVKIEGGVLENHGTLSAKKIKIYNSDFLNLGTITLTDYFKINTGNGTNDGTLTIAKQLDMESSSDVFENYDNVTVGDDSDIYGTLNNWDGTFHFVEKLELKGGSQTYNLCKLIVDKDLKLTGDLENDGYVECSQKLDVNATSEITMGAGSLIDTEDLDLDGDIIGPTSAYAKIEVADETKLNWGSDITGKIDLCDADGTIETNNGTIGGDVTYCVNEVPSTDCVPGNGSNPNDQDNDGIPDSLDEYPTDPDRAFNSYYPNSNDYGSFAFEDLWPNMGDYDFNDLVINFQYQTVTNAGNSIVDLIAKFKIKAAGASFNNGFGFAFDALPATVASVTGTQILGSIVQIAANGLEDGHITQSVVIVYDKINNYTGTGMLNTDPNIAILDIALTTVTINFGTPQASIGTEPYNPFIFIDETRGREVHLVNNEPTELVDLSYFGTADDVSSVVNSIFYKTVDNYPFALETPVPMDYPTEKDDIVTAHLKFSNWAESSGSNYQDWYENLTGYRNNVKIISN
ncbi:MAG: LruC domain-containing protein [Bacteroidota bacterium]|nr:LruC domain-containing protein [Bacteroidota bacterium]